LSVDDVFLHLIAVGELLLNHWEGLLVLPAPTESVVSVDEEILSLPDDEGVAAALVVETAV
jgi:hypothetical protein